MSSPLDRALLQDRLADEYDDVNQDRSSDDEPEGEEGEEDVNSVAERAKASKMTINTAPSPELDKVYGDQKTIEVEYGPLHDMKILVEEKMFMARLADLGTRAEECSEFIVEFFRTKDK